MPQQLKTWFLGSIPLTTWSPPRFLRISSKLFAAYSRSQCVPPFNLQQQGPLHHLQIRHKMFRVIVGVRGWGRRSEVSKQMWPSLWNGIWEWKLERVWGGTQPPMKSKPDFADNWKSRCDNDPPPLLSIIRQRQCLPLLNLRRLTMSFLLPPLNVLAPSLSPQPELKPQCQCRLRHRCRRLVILDCIRFEVIDSNRVGQSPEGKRTQELGDQWLIHKWGNGQNQQKCWWYAPCYPTPPPAEATKKVNRDENEDDTMEE